MSLTGMSLADLARTCRDETNKFLRGEPRDDAFCFEIFERAIAHRDHDAWESIITQYRGIVVAYIGQHTAAGLVPEDDHFWVNRAFQRFWMALSPERFDRFPDLAALLKYLKMCVHSVLMDEVRARRSAQVTSLDAVPPEAATTSDSERLAIGELARQQLWQAIRREVQDEREVLVVELSFVRGLKPGEIYERHPDRYADVGEVYRVKRNALERLRRSPEIRSFLE
jgi:DNA-directed RNA polymerase specialized sigma24 family protein